MMRACASGVFGSGRICEVFLQSTFLKGVGGQRSTGLGRSEQSGCSWVKRNQSIIVPSGHGD